LIVDDDERLLAEHSNWRLQLGPDKKLNRSVELSHGGTDTRTSTSPNTVGSRPAQQRHLLNPILNQHHT
jgi:hypothetical protein